LFIINKGIKTARKEEGK